MKNTSCDSLGASFVREHCAQNCA